MLTAASLKHAFQVPHHDLVTMDGRIEKITFIDHNTAHAELLIEYIAPNFVGFDIPSHLVVFNLKSTLAQLGLHSEMLEHALDRHHQRAQVKIELKAIGPAAREMLSLLTPMAYIGKLFAKDDRRRVHHPYYLERMFGRTDSKGRPLLSFGGSEKGEHLVLEQVHGHMVAYIHLRKGRFEYQASLFGFLPTLAMALTKNFPARDYVRLHQIWREGAPRLATLDRILLVATEPLHIRTAFARVVDELLPVGFHHTSANILEPSTQASGDIYELYGDAPEELTAIPLEFFTLEPYREHVFFSDRDQLRHLLEDDATIFDIFKKAPGPDTQPCAVFVVKGSQLARLRAQDWISSDPTFEPFPRDVDPNHQIELVRKYIEEQPSTPFLTAIESGAITSEGVLFTRFFPTPLLKQLLISRSIQSLIKGIYFQIPSRSGGDYFSQEDRATLLDLVSFGIPTYWADTRVGRILQFVLRPGKSSGLFVPLANIDTFRKATFFGIYGSNLISGTFEKELKELLIGMLELRKTTDHPLLRSNSPIALLTGGGPGVMAMGNRVAQELGILSCAHVVDFRNRPSEHVWEQRQNPYVDAKMTYRLSQLIERQAEFYLDFPIFLMGGIGTDFELCLEELRHKVANAPLKPILLFGEPSYWRDKLSSRFHCNLRSGTIQGSEWVSNCFFCVQNAAQGLKVYSDFLHGRLPLGPTFPPALDDGFVIVD